jgi:hypothetical protein
MVSGNGDFLGWIPVFRYGKDGSYVQGRCIRPRANNREETAGRLF